MRIDGYYDLEQVGASETRVKYFVDADPAGWIPKWLIRLASEESPLKTIQGLRRRVKTSKAANQYAAFLKRYRDKETYQADPKVSDSVEQ